MGLTVISSQLPSSKSRDTKTQTNIKKSSTWHKN